MNGVGRGRSVGWFDLAAIKALVPFFALIGKQARGVFAIDVDVAKHNCGAISCHVIDLI